MSLITAIADVIVAQLNAQAFSKSLTAVRLYDSEAGLSDLTGGRVIVVPKDKARTATASRSLHRRDLRVDVGVQAKLTTAPGQDTEELDGWMDYVDELEQFLDRLSWTSEPIFVVTGVENKPAYAPEHLRGLRVFTSLLTLSVKVNWRNA